MRILGGAHAPHAPPLNPPLVTLQFHLHVLFRNMQKKVVNVLGVWQSSNTSVSYRYWSLSTSLSREYNFFVTWGQAVQICGLSSGMVTDTWHNPFISDCGQMEGLTEISREGHTFCSFIWVFFHFKPQAHAQFYKYVFTPFIFKNGILRRTKEYTYHTSSSEKYC